MDKEINKKKLILIISLGIITIIFIVLIFISFFKDNKKENKKTSNLKIWILNDSKEDFLAFFDTYKKDTKNSFVNASIETFDNYQEYNLALASAFAKGEAPDLFMLNNNEKSLFLENIRGINPSAINPDDFRNDFKLFFSEDLITSMGKNKDKIEFLIGVPLGYETLGVLFDFKKIQSKNNFKNFSYIEGLIEDKKNSPFIPIGIGDGSTTKNSSDIFTQFLMSKDIISINNIDGTSIKEALSEYFEFSSGKNSYSSLGLKNSNMNNIEAFANGKIGAIFAYPRDLLKIDEYGFSRNYLRATYFPDFINDSKKLVKYNYFVMNKNSTKKEEVTKFLVYLASEKGEYNYLSYFKYYIPARLSLYTEDILNRNITDSFNIKLKNFYNNKADYSSFDKGLVSIYDENTKELLDNNIGYIKKFSNFYKKLSCMTIKVLKLTNLSKSCE